MEVVIKADAKEIAALVVELQERRKDADKAMFDAMGEKLNPQTEPTRLFQ